MTTKIIYNPTPDPDWAFIEKWLKTPHGEMVVEPVVIKVENALRSWDRPKKPQNLKHTMPYWVDDWRSKK